MARNTQFFSQAFVAVILDGKPVEGFMDGDAVRIIPNTEGSSMVTGFDGSTTTFSTDQSGSLELDFKGTSITLERINRLWAAQKTASARLFDCQVVTSAAEPIRLEGCSISSIGTIATAGKQASARTVVLNVQKITPQ